MKLLFIYIIGLSVALAAPAANVARAPVDLDPNVVKDATSLEEIQLLDYLDEGIAWGK
ncbi:hypothetical protein L207DRAFT_505180 [Hyaloscypha variabilis F]|uniref:Uncharacterized protein n=1 Tax=Hyaloscypha variabilis (strain UAMH 11265 / GT02V1 / F) TaxID=1149755 RepID=A0A2J6SBI3_HYAVF|nr:hypothetical protein L207DRAFT_505180 [Hyaloscypha variabilis F]